MSTNINNLQLASVDLSAAEQAMAAGLPDPFQLAQWANQYAQLLDGVQQSPVSQLPIAGDTVSQLNLPSLSGADLQLFANTVKQVEQEGGSAGIVPKLPSEKDLFATASIGNAYLNPTQLPISGSPGFPGVPGGISAGQFSTVPEFSFLNDARPLWNQTGQLTNVEQKALSTIKIPVATEVGDVSSAFKEYTPQGAPAISGEAIAAPQLAGAVARSGDKGLPGAFSFLESARGVDFIEANIKDADNGGYGQKGNTVVSPTLFDVGAIRRDFPILQEIVNGKQLVWFDNAATTQKPSAVIERIKYFYEHENSNVHRAAHTLAARSTDAYDAAREKVRRFLNAGSVNEIVFVRGATEAINLVAKSWGEHNIQQGDEIVISHLEHHANIVPWQMLCASKGAALRVIPVDNSGQLLLDEYQKLLNSKTKLVAVTQVSNALGTVTPVEEIVAAAHRYGAKVLIDGAQAVSHKKVDVQAYDCDFYVFSGHKVFGPTGIGVVYGKEDILNATPPWQGGGNMIQDVTFEKTVYHPAPFRFEAGTGNIADAVGLGAAIDYVEKIGIHHIDAYEHALLEYATKELVKIPGVRVVGTAKEKASVLSFVLDGYTTEQVGQALNKEGIAVRSGHHCAQPILRRFGVEATVRPSLAFYNTCEEVDLFIATVWNLTRGRRSGL